MTSRFQQSYRCFNGPKEGFWIDAPGAMDPGSSCALAWSGADSVLRYAVYTLVEHEVEGETVRGLMYIKSHETPERAQAHVHEITLVVNAAKHAQEMVS